VHWGERLAVLSQAYLTFYEADNTSVEIDRIPLVEIAKISSKFLENRGIEVGEPLEAGGRLGEQGGKRVSEKSLVFDTSTYDMTFLIRTVPGGRNCGRNYTLCCAEAGDFWDFVNTLHDAIQDAKKWHEDQLLTATIGTSELAKFRHRTNLYSPLPSSTTLYYHGYPPLHSSTLLYYPLPPSSIIIPASSPTPRWLTI